MHSVGLLLCLLGTLSACSLVASDPICRFSGFLTRRSRWETRITMERKNTETFIRFHDTVMEEVSYGPLGDHQIHRECVRKLADEKYVVKRVADGRPVYSCLQTLKLSENLIQLKVSTVQGDHEDESLCADATLTLDDWVLVWPNVDIDQGANCPVIGGYEFKLYDSREKSFLCGDTWLKPRMESDCMTGEGMTFDFRTFECRGTLGMELKQKLACLGSWQTGKYLFSVVSNADELWPKLWIMRFPVERDGDFTAYISGDIVADRSELFEAPRTYFRLSMSMAVYPTLCENEAESSSCKSCDGYNDVYCQKFCHKCDASRGGLQECSVDEEWRGEWQELNHWGSSDITLTKTMLYVDEMMPFQCYNLHQDDSWADSEHTQNRRAMVTVFKNGCKPRYTCTEYQKISDSVMKFRMSQHLVWPHTMAMMAEDICGTERFQDDDTPVANRYRSEHFKFLVRKTTSTSVHLPVPCGIRGRFSLDIPGYTDCLGSISSCEKPDTFSLKPRGDCSQTESMSGTFTCIAANEDGDYKFLITEREGDPSEMHCWLFHWHETERFEGLYKLQPADCNTATPGLIRGGNVTHHMAHYLIEDTGDDEPLVNEEACEGQALQGKPEGPDGSRRPVPSAPYTPTKGPVEVRTVVSSLRSGAASPHSPCNRVSLGVVILAYIAALTAFWGSAA